MVGLLVLRSHSLENPVAYVNMTVREYLRQLLLETPGRWYPPGAYENSIDLIMTFLRPLDYQDEFQFASPSGCENPTST